MKNFKNKIVNNSLGFTLVEIAVGILIFSIVITAGFYSLSALMIGKIRLIEETAMEKKAFYFSEKFFEMVKKGGTLDYEEYFNRKIVGTVYQSGHYMKRTGFGNFGPDGTVGSSTYGMKFYYCRSGTTLATKMGTGGCVVTTNTGALGQDSSYLGPQRYGQYSFQFKDYNVNNNADLGDENGDGNIIGDDDDEWLGEGPEVFTGGIVMRDLYLINGDKTKRTMFRWNVKDDPNRGPLSSCNYGTGSSPTGSGCLGTIEFLKLNGKDRGMDHNSGAMDSDGTQYDGIIDTWIIDPDFTGGAEIVAGSDTIQTTSGYSSYDYWQPIFPDTVNVRDVKFYLFPNKSLDYAWMDTTPETNISPYVRIGLILSPDQKTRRKIKGKIPEIIIKTTVALTNIFSN